MSSCVVSSWWRHGQFGEPNDVIGYPNAFLCGKIQSFHGGCAWDILQMLVKAERSNIESWNWSWEIQQEPDKLSCTRVEQSSEKAQGRRVEELHGNGTVKRNNHPFLWLPIRVLLELCGSVRFKSGGWMSAGGSGLATVPATLTPQQCHYQLLKEEMHGCTATTSCELWWGLPPLRWQTDAADRSFPTKKKEKLPSGWWVCLLKYHGVMANHEPHLMHPMHLLLLLLLPLSYWILSFAVHFGHWSQQSLGGFIYGPKHAYELITCDIANMEASSDQKP